MGYMEYLERPVLRSPILITAFEGWNDASEVATWSARYLVRQWSAKRFAYIDPEEFYVFTETRPQVRISEENQRIIEWPSNELFFHQDPQGEHDFVIMVGIEPNLKWKAFVGTIMDIIRETQVSLVLTLGGLLAPVAHTQPARLTGTATDADLLAHLHEIGVTSSRYEGPTGIVGILNSSLSKENIPTASLWGNVPHYLSARPNIRVSLAMIRQLNQVFRLDMDLRRVERQAARFDTQVNDAVAGNTEISSYVRKLEEAVGLTDANEHESHGAELPSGEAVVRELEEYLRQRRQDEPGEPEKP